MKKILILILFPISLKAQTSANYFNNALAESENTTLRNYNGSGIKERSIRVHNVSKEDTIGKIISQEFFDEAGNKTKAIFYESGKIVGVTTLEYNSQHQLTKLLHIHKEDTIVEDKIKYNKENNIVSYKRTKNNGNYALIKYKYTKEGRLKERSYEWYYQYNIQFIMKNVSQEKFEKVGPLLPTEDNKKNWTFYIYYTGETPEIKSGLTQNIEKEYCMLDQNNNIINIKQMTNGKIIKNISIKYDQNNRAIENKSFSEQDSDKIYRYVYSYLYY